jgi:hypothetical protein
VAELPNPRQLVGDVKALTRYFINDRIDAFINWWLQRQR